MPKVLNGHNRALNYSIRNASGHDLASVLQLNESEVPHVGRISLDDMQDFLAKAVYFRVACNADDQVVAFLIGLDPDTDYHSPNFLWFRDHYKNFAYIDRIAVAPGARRQGVAEALYADFADATSDWSVQLCCEVNLRPENPVSMTFHKRLGFRQVGTLESDNGAKSVAFLLKPAR